MSRAIPPRVLEVWLHGQHAGWLCEAGGVTRFIVTESYMANFHRSTLSLSMTMPRAEWLSQNVLGNRFNPAVYRERGELPPYFAGLLPEGALKQRLAATRRHGADMDDLGILAAAGEDLPGAVKVVPADLDKLTPTVRAYGVEDGVGELGLRTPEGAAAGLASLSGVQNKLALLGTADGKRFNLPAKGFLSNTVAKLPAPGDDSLVVNEFVCMQLAALVGVDVASCRPEPMQALEGQQGMIDVFGAKTSFLAVDRFDRDLNRAIHIEDACQLMTLMPQRKYEIKEQFPILIGLLNRLSMRGIEDVRQLFIRQAVNTLLGNSDAHLKNFSVIYRDNINPELSPAYDIVSVTGLPGFKSMTMNRAIDQLQRAETLESYGALAKRAGISGRIAKAAVKRAVSLAKDLWPDALRKLEAPVALREHILTRLEHLPLAKEK